MTPIVLESSYSVLAVGRLNAAFDSQFDQFYGTSANVSQTLLSLVQLMLAKNPLPEECFYELCSNVFESLTMMSSWLRSLNDKSGQNMQLKETFDSLIQSLTETATRCLIEFPPKHTILASRLLSKISSQVRPNSYSLDQINQLIALPSNLNSPLDTISENTWNFAANLFFYPPSNTQVSSQEWNTRGEQFQVFMEPILDPICSFFQLDMAKVNNQSEIQQNLYRSFRIIKAVISAANEGTLQTRTVCFKGVQVIVDLLPAFLNVFRFDLHGKSLLMSVISTLIEVLNKQLCSGKDQFIPGMVHSVQQELLDRQQYNPTMEEINFKFLIMITKQHLCMESMIQFIPQLYSALAQYPKTETLQELLKLTDQTLSTNYTFFFDSKISSKQRVGAHTRQEMFSGLFQLVINSLNAQEPDIVRDTIGTLQSLETNYKFYETVL